MALQNSVSRLAQQLLGRLSVASYATKATAVAPVPGVDWKSVPVPAATVKDIPETIGGIVPKGDLRATSGLGLGDGISNHTDKWLTVGPDAVKPLQGTPSVGAICSAQSCIAA